MLPMDQFEILTNRAYASSAESPCWGVGAEPRRRRRNRDCEGRRRLGIPRQVDAVTIPQQLSTIALTKML